MTDYFQPINKRIPDFAAEIAAGEWSFTGLRAGTKGAQMIAEIAAGDGTEWSMEDMDWGREELLRARNAFRAAAEMARRYGDAAAADRISARASVLGAIADAPIGETMAGLVAEFTA